MDVTVVVVVVLHTLLLLNLVKMGAENKQTGTVLGIDLQNRSVSN